MKNKSENIWEDENIKVRIVIEVEEKQETPMMNSDDLLSQAKYCIAGLGFNVGQEGDAQ